ncbi:hypothetical protein IFM89_011387 [Coptis chinensis]|uniref:histidine--tRNA ligase n=1 Tax=Coptis chinensis TaxID=261450 RepID=A0A835I1H2_9MAGN|nr:hypothetical protein IFM89_011387 [Coptis chinensis]
MASDNNNEQVTVVTIGGKDSYLTSSSVYAVANNFATTKIDSSALSKLSSTQIQTQNPNPNPNPNQNSKFLTKEESRASLLVLLNKLIRTSINIRPDIPRLILHTLDNNVEEEDKLDWGSVSSFLDGLRFEDRCLTDGELYVLENSFVGLEGICAILDHSSLALAVIADGIAALSCEALGVNIKGLDKFMDSGDGLSDKDVCGVASDLKVLLVNSKLVGKVEEMNVVSKIPAVHGSLREAVRLLHAGMRGGLNSSVPSEDALGRKVSSLASSLLLLGKSSWGRGKLICELISDEGLRSNVLKMFEGSVKNLNDVYRNLDELFGVDYTSYFHEVYSLLVKVREIVAWEGGLALFVLEKIDPREKPVGVSVVSSSIQVNKKSDKKKKGKLGKGTGQIRETIMNRLKNNGDEAVDDSQTLIEWARDLFLFFSPSPSLDVFLKTLKGIVDSNESTRLPKLPKGTRDFAKEQMAIRQRAFSIIQNVFEKHGATALDTPVFEMRETLMGKYGEDSKLIYDLADQIKLNHRKLLDGMLEICGVPPEKFRTICSSIDKLDKLSFEQISIEMVETKGLTVEIAESIGKFVKKRGPPLEILSDLKQEGSPFLKKEGSTAALNDLEILFRALETSGSLHRVVFDLSLARGLDYYTGVIFEAVFKGSTQARLFRAFFLSILEAALIQKLLFEEPVQQGSNLKGLLYPRPQKTHGSLFVVRKAVRAMKTQVLVGIVGDDLPRAAELASELWRSNLKAEFMVNKKVKKLIDRAVDSNIPWMVIEGDEEKNGGVVTLKDVEKKTDKKIATGTMVEELTERLKNTS